MGKRRSGDRGGSAASSPRARAQRATDRRDRRTPQRRQERAVQPARGRARWRSSTTRPGVTRDRLYADARVYGRDYVLIDTGGFDPESDDPLKQSIAAQVHVALSEADVVICVLDGTMDPLPADREAVKLLRQTELPVLYVANKIDNASDRASTPRSCTGSASTSCARSRRCTATASATSKKRLPTRCRDGRARGRSRAREPPSAAADRDRRPPERRQVVARQSPARRGAPDRRRPPRHHRRQRRRAVRARTASRSC